MDMSKTSRKPNRPTIVDDIDAITPCPLARSPAEEIEIPELVSPIDKFQESRSPSPCSDVASVRMDAFRNRRRESVKALEEGTNGDPVRLWKRMLALQQTYGCYKSARMSAALSSGDISLLLPSKACLNLLNENMAFLPDEAEDALGEWQSDLGGGRNH
ncbi:uncharacterized protein F4807DRAFT_330640 [Annulohypoxylon truncatum]|uniref:uncharacterized protein n=1 Tax=Annulohypoxylon truncatum TaxID=327061 RepID=UPI0020081FB3|nr:uncharacterized protein F4807DRAFT_330640 [Annulohypoxylon truncatum]KAI1204492.1 hypothetical protein F4807DRAFT_330640 [Annulohypoxylon truncatum]